MKNKAKNNAEESRKTEALLKVKDLSLSFIQYTSGLRQTELKVISNLSIEAYRGKILAVVGSSGSGKSLLAHAILGILPPNAILNGKIEYNGMQLTQEKKEEIRGKEIASGSQSVTYLDPLMRVSDQVIGCGGRKSRIDEEAPEEIFQRYGLKPDVERMFPMNSQAG